MHGLLFVIFLAVALFFGVIWFVASIIKATKRAEIDGTNEEKTI